MGQNAPKNTQICIKITKKVKNKKQKQRKVTRKGKVLDKNACLNLRPTYGDAIRRRSYDACFGLFWGYFGPF